MWTLYLRNAALEREGQIDDFEKVEAIARFNQVGTWRVDIDGRARLAGKLAQPGYGIELVRDDTTVVMSGPMRHRVYARDGDQLQLTVSGVDDTIWLQRRVAHPQPATAAPPYNTNEYDVRSGVASTVLRAYVNANAGISALAPRQIPGLDVDTDPLLGSSITGRARWQVLLTLLQELAISGGGLGFRIQKTGPALLFQVYAPTDRTGSVILSTEMGNLYGYTYESECSEVNYCIIGGGGEGTARTIREGFDGAEVAAWGRVEAFQDRRDTTDAGELDQEITKTLAEGAGKTGLSINPVDITGMVFLADYNLGDRVTYVIDGEPSTEVIREARIILTPDGPQQTIPGLNTPGRADVLRLLRRLRIAEAKILDLERR